MRTTFHELEPDHLQIHADLAAEYNRLLTFNPSSISGDAMFATTHYGVVAGGTVHTNGPKLQTFVNGALSTGRRHVIDCPGIINLESGVGAPFQVIVDLSTAVYPKTVIEWAPGAVLTAPNAFGKTPTYFTGASRATKTVTLAVPSGHGVVAGDTFEVYCPTWDFDNGDYIVTSVTATTVVYTQDNAVGTNFTSGSAGSHGGWIKVHKSCFKVINPSVNKTLELIRPQFAGPGVTVDPNTTPPTPALGNGPSLCGRVERHGLVSNGFYAGAVIEGTAGSNTDHYHAYDDKDLGSNFYGLYFRDILNSGTRDFRIDNGGYGPCKRAGIACSISGRLPDLSAKDVHTNASPYGWLKEGFRGVALAGGNPSLLFDDAEFTGICKSEGSGNIAINGGEANYEKVGGSYRIHGLEINAGGGVNHTLRDITLTGLTRATTVVTATYSRTSAGTTTNNSCVITGLTANAFTWKDVGCELIKSDVPAGAFIMAILSTTSVLLSDAATGASTNTCYSVPRLQVGDHLAIYTDDAGVTLNRPAIIKTLSGTGFWHTGGAGPFTMTAETVGDTGTITTTAATAGCLGGMRGGVYQHTVGTFVFSTQTDSTTNDTMSESYWDFIDMDVCEFGQSRHPNAHAGYSAYPSVNLRNGSTGSLRVVFRHGDDEVMLVKVGGTIAAGETTEISTGGSRIKSTVDPLHPRGGEALQPGATTTTHATGATQTSRPYIWVARKGSFRNSAGWPGIKVTGAVASGDLLVEDPAGTDGTVIAWTTGAGMRKIGTATGAAAGGICPYEVLMGESWTV